jgi:hypothetical protein
MIIDFEIVLLPQVPLRDLSKAGGFGALNLKVLVVVTGWEHIK